MGQVSEIQIAPVNMTMTVGEERTFLATAYDATGNPVLTADFAWISTDLQVVTVRFDPTSPQVATVTAVGVGVAQIEARSGITIRSQSVIQVSAAPTPTVVLPDSVLPGAVTTSSLSQIARIDPQIFGTAVSCRVGGFVEEDLLVTTYTAIRGAESIGVTLPNGRRINDAQVAAYDVDANLAIIYVDRTDGGSLSVGNDGTSSQRVWSLAQPGCQQTVATNLQITAQRGGMTEVNRDLGQGQIGAPLINRDGEVVGVFTEGNQAVPASRIPGLIREARALVTSQALLSAEQVASRENHGYGSVAMRSDVLAASARVTPLEDWHWNELATEQRLPFTLTGPAGRYRVELLAGGQVLNTVTVEPQASTVTQTLLSRPVVAGGQTDRPSTPQIQSAGGGGFPVAVLLIGVVAAGGGAALLLGGGGDGGGGTPPPAPGPTTGGITIRIPIPGG